MDPFDLWTGRHVRLRAVLPTDAEAFLADGLDTEAARHADAVALPASPARLRERIDAVRDGDNAWLAVESLASGTLAGSVTVHGADPRHRHFEYGIAIFAPARRQGFAREAVALTLRYYFLELGYHRATATVYAFNAPSLALHRALGFHHEGTLRESLFSNGRWHDELVFSLLDREFDALGATLPPVPFAG